MKITAEKMGAFSTIAKIVFLLSLSWLSVASIEIKHLQHGEVLKISYGQSNYALNEPCNENNNWKTFAVNDNSVTITTSDCKVQTKNLQSLDSKEQECLKQVKDRIEAHEIRYPNPNGSPDANDYPKPLEFGDSISAVFSLTGIQLSENSLIKPNSGSTLDVRGTNGLIFDKLGDTLTVGGKNADGLGGDLLRVAQNSQVFASVNSNGEVQMKPTNCMSLEEQQKMSKFWQEFEKISAGTKLNESELPVVRAGLNVKQQMMQDFYRQQMQDLYNQQQQQQQQQLYPQQQFANQQNSQLPPQSNQYGNLQQYPNQQQMPNQWPSQFNPFNQQMQQPYQQQMQQPYQQQMQQPYQQQQYFPQQQQWPLMPQTQQWMQQPQSMMQQLYQQPQQYYPSYQQPNQLYQQQQQPSQWPQQLSQNIQPNPMQNYQQQLFTPTAPIG